jgi:pyruvate formate lyase activating enzyme
MESEGRIFDIKRYAIHDGPGIRTTVFLKGCPLKCPWCHNPEGISSRQQLAWRRERCRKCHDCVDACPEGAISFSKGILTLDETRCDDCGQCVSACCSHALELVGEDIEVGQLIEQVEKDIIFYDQSGGGVTFSGGEPFMQPDFLESTLGECRRREIHTVVDTSGYVDQETLSRVARDIDLFLWDLKIMDDEKHITWTGVSNRTILRNLKILSKLGKKVIIRVSLVPGINDDKQNVLDLGAFVASLDNIERVDVLPYHGAWVEKYKRLYRKKEPFLCRPPSREAVRTVEDELNGLGLKVRIGG